MRALLKNTTLRTTVALVAVLACGCALVACSESSGGAQKLLAETFSGHSQIESGRVALSFGVTAKGSSGAAKPLSVRLTGPFQSRGTGKLPEFDLHLDLTAAGHSLGAGAISTGSALYVQLAGTWFSTPPSTYKALEEGYARAASKTSPGKVRSTFSSLGIEPAKWLSQPSEAGTATVAGVQTIHISAGVNIPAFLADVSKLSQAGGAFGLTSPVPGASPISPAVVDELAKSIEAAHVDVYTGRDDHTLRRLEVSATVSGTAQTKPLLGGLSSADVKLALQFEDLGKAQHVVAPPSPQPASQLLPALQQLFGALQSAGSQAGLQPPAKG